ncbi:hypothetical protein SPRG_08924 [Saprolegnia parasitica CBS 223.65]|uniref:Uncharacterized protein n=1 Tax=Saprolegnia parasitica (strain CBS 223.65) TaxID=695850 RepID=A0A067C8Y8_SAPPC|nr:hypothetical protein SPRG_08924 [Saprolegnia parasitica CBS 223.65]KDO25625.1 hypothetical protein SPRG_08924 [Saprolegnia parasitica CBS 223.65]|eukprot:XP_012203658.1 hypothetical protein SPRG_08924 [Saprolegnia parasitica CBS 223.65]
MPTEAASTTSAPTDAPAAFPPDERCKYAYKECKERRSRRKNGKLHSLCDYHRKKANSVQKSYATKRRNMQQARAKAEPAFATPPPAPLTAYALPAPLLPRGYGVYHEPANDHALRLDEIKRRIQSAWERRHAPPGEPSSIYYSYPSPPHYPQVHHHYEPVLHSFMKPIAPLHH